MSEKVKFETIPLRYSGIFDFQSLYTASKSWFGSVNAISFESLYKDKVSGPSIREVEIKTLGFVKWDRYRKWNIEINFRTWDMKEIVVDGKNIVQGRIEIKIDGDIEYDYADMYTKRAKSKLLKTLGQIFSRVMKNDKDFTIKSSCEKEMYRLQTQFKQILKIPS